MKKILRNNQVIITALVVMIAVAGYLSAMNGKNSNFLGGKKNPKEIAEQSNGSNDTLHVADDLLGIDQKGAADAASTKVTSDPLTTADPASKDTVSKGKDDNNEFADISDEDVGKDSKDVASDDSELGDSVMADSTISSSFFSSAKVKREQTRAKNKELLMEIVNNATIKESQKQKAIDSIVEMTNIAEKESAAEILLEAKGFKDVVISIVDEGADVLINAEKLTDQNMAQIEDIVKRKTGISADKIVITPERVAED